MTATRKWPKSSPQSEIHAAFMIIGLRHADQVDLLPLSDIGQFELVNNLCEYAAILGDMERIAAATVGGYPGVFEYEVSDSFGAWYGEKLITKTELKKAEVIDQIRTLVINFFADDDMSDREDLIAALDFQYVHGKRLSRLGILWRRVKKSFESVSFKQLILSQ